MIRQKFLVFALAALGALAVVATGCGGSGDSSTVAHKAKPKEEETAKLSKADFIRQGDSICAEVNTAIGSAASTEGSGQTTQVANLYIGMVQSLQQLGQPAETTGFSEFMGAAEELAMVEGEVKTASEAEEALALEEASQAAVPAVEEFHSQAAVYGFEPCSEEPHAPETTVPETTEEPSVEEPGGVEVAPEEEIVPEEEFIPEEEVAPEEEEIAPETGGAGGEIEETAPEEEGAGGESGGIGPG